MARLISVPGVASLLVVSGAAEIDDLIDHPSLERAFARDGRLFNRLLVGSLDRQMRHQGAVLPAFRPQGDATRVAGQARLFGQLDAAADAGAWPTAPVAEMARYVADGRNRRGAEAALAYAVAWPFLGLGPASPLDDAYKPQGRYLWRLHRRIARARKLLSPVGFAYRLLGVDRRARAAIIERLGGDLYGLHAVEITLANARVILETMREIVDEGLARPLSPRDLAWGAIRTAPEVVVRQSPDVAATLPHVGPRVPRRTIVLFRMRRSLGADVASGYEFASRHWSACPARRYVMGLFEAVAAASAGLSGRGARG